MINESDRLRNPQQLENWIVNKHSKFMTIDNFTLCALCSPRQVCNGNHNWADADDDESTDEREKNETVYMTEWGSKAEASHIIIKNDDDDTLKCKREHVVSLHHQSSMFYRSAKFSCLGWGGLRARTRESIGRRRRRSSNQTHPLREASNRCMTVMTHGLSHTAAEMSCLNHSRLVQLKIEGSLNIERWNTHTFRSLTHLSLSLQFSTNKVSSNPSISFNSSVEHSYMECWIQLHIRYENKVNEWAPIFVCGKSLNR